MASMPCSNGAEPSAVMCRSRLDRWISAGTVRQLHPDWTGRRW